MISCGDPLIVNTSEHKEQPSTQFVWVVIGARAPPRTRRQKLDVAENTSNGDQSSLTDRDL